MTKKIRTAKQERKKNKLIHTYISIDRYCVNSLVPSYENDLKKIPTKCIFLQSIEE